MARPPLPRRLLTRLVRILRILARLPELQDRLARQEACRIAAEDRLRGLEARITQLEARVAAWPARARRHRRLQDRRIARDRAPRDHALEERIDRLERTLSAGRAAPPPPPWLQAPP
ncbi:hypothetical protein, partial [Ectothiorhodospira mobilis]|uniref:hypothetical protein n=1 Tax=Ectothiorhodospira mobilis TaxID=195064 RepID=UPI001906966E